VLEGSNDVALSYWPFASLGRAIINNDRKGWPDTEILPDRGSAGAENLEIETGW
jgi:hypothetical protein